MTPGTLLLSGLALALAGVAGLALEEALREVHKGLRGAFPALAATGAAAACLGASWGLLAFLA